ncbi:DUF6153 family protein [Leucobacter sp. wl10]|uniref:DUF6153 family protein n=1 Tax=Leucobacter sp. wl10 TaxID=2304677 RepID=UPI001F09AA8E|nr:DUF6153 family protein [Leucobacter sp. wl10]
MLILGLVAMHSLSGSASAHDALVPASTVSADDTGHPAQAGPLAGPANAAADGCDSSCAHSMATDPGHLGMLMLCLLALLTGLLFLLRPALFRLSRAAAQSLYAPALAMPASPAARPPSLRALSISRT